MTVQTEVRLKTIELDWFCSSCESLESQPVGHGPQEEERRITTETRRVTMNDPPFLQHLDVDSHLLSPRAQPTPTLSPSTPSSSAAQLVVWHPITAAVVAFAPVCIGLNPPVLPRRLPPSGPTLTHSSPSLVESPRAICFHQERLIDAAL